MPPVIFAYDELTWQQVAALPRSTPLLLPLGGGYDLPYLARSLGDPTELGVLPAIPFGWQGSPLPVPTPVFRQLVANLVSNLQEDGFERVYLLAPPGVELGLGAAELRLARQGGDEILPPAAALGKVILVPVGHTEQHGCHLPLSVDTICIDAVSQGTARAVPGQAYALPVFPYGVSTHRRSFPGTMNVGGRAFEDFWLAVVDHLVKRGFETQYLLSGHGGNCSFLTNVVKYAGERHLAAFIATAWLYLSGPEGIKALKKHRRSKLGGMGHACELETALMLHLRPHLVHMERVVDETAFITTPSYTMDWIESGALVANPPWQDDTRTGAYGAGSLATAQNGHIWLEAAVSEKVTHVSEILEQHRRRGERRASAWFNEQ
ncbi:MAG: creatininase family protein [Anaerolineae bacterium]|nr:creatininase family protein [Anaerolineae bacterium]